MSHDIADLAGVTLGTGTVTGLAPGRGSNGSLLWHCRCSACGLERVVTGTHLRTLQRKGRPLPCPRCLNRVSKCGLCRQQGHTTDACHRVVGIRCKRCRLRYEAEPVEGIDYAARNPGALARMMGGGS